MRRKSWKVAATIMLTGSVLQVGCFTQRQINAFTNDILGALTNNLANFITDDFDFGTIFP